MDFDAFTGEVQHRARLSSKGEALRASRATLEVLFRRMESGAATNIAAQLPMELREIVDPEAATERFDLDEFYRRVAETEGVEYPDAAHHARAVLSVVDEATQGLLLGKYRAQFPDDYDRLFEDIENFERTYG